MLALTSLLSFAALALRVAAAPSSETVSPCPDGRVVYDSYINAKDVNVHQQIYACSDQESGLRTAGDGSKNVCGSLCITSCNTNAGILPPISEDCDAIYLALSIVKASNTTDPTFTVAPGRLTQFTYGTCAISFTNRGEQNREYCWGDFITTARGIGSACFPPANHLKSQGVCTSYDGFWNVATSHS